MPRKHKTVVTNLNLRRFDYYDDYNCMKPHEEGSKCKIPQEFLCCNDDVIFFSEKKMTSSLQHKNSWGKNSWVAFRTPLRRLNFIHLVSSRWFIVLTQA